MALLGSPPPVTVRSEAGSPLPASQLARLEQEVRGQRSALAASAQVAAELAAPSGPRDRFGQPRRNVGGRPRENLADLSGATGRRNLSNI